MIYICHFICHRLLHCLDFRLVFVINGLLPLYPSCTYMYVYISRKGLGGSTSLDIYSFYHFGNNTLQSNW